MQKLEQQKENVVVIGKEEQKIRTLPKTKVDCPKCGHKEAFYWLVQTGEQMNPQRNSSDAQVAGQLGVKIPSVHCSGSHRSIKMRKNYSLRHQSISGDW